MASRDVVPFSPGRFGGGVDPLLELHRKMNRLFDDAFRVGGSEGGPSGPASMMPPRLDVDESDGELRLQADVPGVRSADLAVRIDGDLLTLSGERRVVRLEAGRRRCRVVGRPAVRAGRRGPDADVVDARPGAAGVRRGRARWRARRRHHPLNRRLRGRYAAAGVRAGLGRARTGPARRAGRAPAQAAGRAMTSDTETSRRAVRSHRMCLSDDGIWNRPTRVTPENSAPCASWQAASR